MPKIRTKRGERDLLDGLLDRLAAGDVAGPKEYAMLLRAAGEARQALRVPVSPETRARHLAAIAALDLLEATPARPRRPRVRRLALALAATLVLALGATATAAASQSALPGDVLYPVKRAVEAVNLALHRSDASKGRVHLQHAERRLTELQALLAARRAGEDVDVGAAMSAYRSELAKAERHLLAAAGEGADVGALLAEVQERIGKHVDVLAFLRDNRVPDVAKPAIQRAIDRAEVAGERVGRGKPAGTPGPPEEAPGRSDEAPGPPEEPPGRSGTAPGQNR